MFESILDLLGTLLGGGVIWAVLAFVFVISILVFFHELGHYLAARSVGIYVETFSIGFGREIFGWNDKNGTRWKVALIPLGGYVRMYAMTGEVKPEEVPETRKHEAFVMKSVLQRMWVVFAGPLANFVLAIVLLTGLFYFVGAQKPLATIGALMPNMPAAEAGFMPGDEIVAIDGMPITYWEDILLEIDQKLATPITFDVYRAAEGKRLTLTATPLEKEVKNVFGETHKRYLIGITVGEAFERVQYGFLDATVAGVEKAYVQGTAILKAVWRMISGEIDAEIGGPLTIGKVAGEQANLGFERLIMFMAFISVNLGLINLFPVPVLDGGHLLYFTIEGILRRPLKESFQEFGNRVGLTFILALMVFAFYKDIINIVVPAFQGL